MNAQEIISLRHKAEQGDAVSQHTLGMLLLIGQEVPQDFDEARLWFRRAANQDYSFSYNALAYIYEKGKGVPRNFSMALEYYLKAENLGCPMALENYLNLRRWLQSGDYDTPAPTFIF